jgi:hypothetical protein
MYLLELSEETYEVGMSMLTQMYKILNLLLVQLTTVACFGTFHLGAMPYACRRVVEFVNSAKIS